MTLGSAIDALWALREKKRKLETQVKEVEAAKACKNSRLLALLPVDADDETPIMVLKVSPTALKAFDSYVASVARSFQLPPLGVVTEIGFDEAVTYTARF